MTKEKYEKNNNTITYAQPLVQSQKYAHYVPKIPQ
jgi:hypothetical protein